MQFNKVFSELTEFFNITPPIHFVFSDSYRQNPTKTSLLKRKLPFLKSYKFKLPLSPTLENIFLIGLLAASFFKSVLAIMLRFFHFLVLWSCLLSFSPENLDRKFAKKIQNNFWFRLFTLRLVF